MGKTGSEIRLQNRRIGETSLRYLENRSNCKSEKKPETKKEVRQILGLLSHFASYIPNYAHVSKCLTELTTNRTPNKVTWLAQHDIAFDTLKHLLSQATENPLYVIDYNSGMNISTDASNYAVSGLLSQTDENGNEKPIAFTSQKLTEAQIHSMPTIEKEAYAVLHALRKFRDFILFSKICIYSDHNPLQYLTEAAPKSSKLMRWALALQEFDISFHYRRAAQNLPADCLSRLVL